MSHKCLIKCFIQMYHTEVSYRRLIHEGVSYMKVSHTHVSCLMRILYLSKRIPNTKEPMKAPMDPRDMERASRSRVTHIRLLRSRMVRLKMEVDMPYRNKE